MNPEDYIKQSGGRAGLHEFGWLQAGYDLDEVESIRQTLLRQNDYGKVQQALQKLGIEVIRDIIQAVKNYNFDSQGRRASDTRDCRKCSVAKRCSASYDERVCTGKKNG